MTLNNILNEQRIYAMINDVPILRESEVHLFEELMRKVYTAHLLLC